MLNLLSSLFIRDVYCYPPYVSSSLLLYSHIPTALIAIAVGIYILRKNKNIEAKIFLFLAIVFFVFSLGDLAEWFAFLGRNIVMIARIILEIVDPLIFILSSYFLYIIVKKRDVKFVYKIIWLLLIFPILFMIIFDSNHTGYNWAICEVKENPLLTSYEFYIDLFYVATATIFAVKEIIKSRFSRQIILITTAVGLFISIFFAMEYVFTGYIFGSAFDYNYFVYAFFGMPILIAILMFMIVKYKTFNIKLIGAQALVWSSIILIGSQFFYLTGSSLVVKILTGITLVITCVLGYNLVRGVKKEVVLNEKLNVANTGQKNLIHIMNHQIKGYLGINRNIFAELLTDDYGKVPEEAKDLIMKGKENSEGGVEYVTGILRGDSAESGSLTFDMKPVDFKEIVSGVVEKIKGAIEKKGLKLTVDIANGAYNILGDSIQLGEAVRNLIENSMHYTPSGEISIRLKQAGGKVLLSVKDTGVGIKKEDKDKLFKAGGVGSESIKINVNSSGYGLAFVKGVIEKHKGKVWFESAGAGKGSTFFVELPVK